MTLSRRFSLFFLALTGSLTILAPNSLPADLTPITWECLSQATEVLAVPLPLALTVLATEGGTVGQISRHRRGDYDIGPMQINSHWLPILKRMGLLEKDLRDHGCANVAVGVWILRLNLLETGDPLKALARYHSPNPKRGASYVQAALRKAQNFNLEKTLTLANAGIKRK